MFEREPTSEDLATLARALGLDFAPERLAAALPEVRRLWAQASQLAALPLDEPPATDASGAAPAGS